ncbi:MAG: redoxin domain-containing protein [Pirellulaceae bacterium]
MFKLTRFPLAALLVALLPPLAAAQSTKPSVVEALKLKPIQVNVEYDLPAAQAAEKCTLTPIKSPQLAGWEVRDADGNVLRRFLDTNADNKVDQWCYFKDGIETYRDIDRNFNRKADECRWLGTSGIRWALDTDEDGRIDSWKAISPEEVSEEVIVALTTHDADRFRRLLMTPEELKGLQLGEQQTKQLGKKIADAAQGIEELAKSQTFVGQDARWVNFGGTRPGVVPAGTDGSQLDLQVYENTVAVIESEGGHGQVIIGTLVRAGDLWRIVDLPRSMADAQAGTMPEGFFFQASLARRAEADVPVTGGLSPEIQQLVDELERIDRELSQATTLDTLAPLNAQRADVLEKLASKATGPEEEATWIRQLADTVSAAVQSGFYPDGIQRLDALCRRLEAEKAAPDLVAYVQFRFLSADYGSSLQAPDADFPKIQDKWLADLEKFVTDFANTKDAAEAMLQLAISEEFAGEDENAVKWYARIASEFPDTAVAMKAAGAKRRMESVGQPLLLEGKDTQGNAVSVSAFGGKILLIHYWATWCGPCLQDISLLKDMQTKYGPENVALLGINVDTARPELDNYLKENSLSWPQLFEPGGLDSPLANALGILTLPTMLLVDKEGKVVNRNLRASEVDTQLRSLLR